LLDDVDSCVAIFRSFLLVALSFMTFLAILFAAFAATVFEASAAFSFKVGTAFFFVASTALVLIVEEEGANLPISGFLMQCLLAHFTIGRDGGVEARSRVWR
jgi:hypothetical protein